MEKTPDDRAQRRPILGLDHDALGDLIAGIGERPFRARQIYGWIYARRARGFEAMTDLPEALRRRLAASWHLGRPEIARVQDASDGTRKYLLALDRGGAVESVFMPEARRITLCISSQIGCALDCRFCFTARMGLARHLDAGEIVSQVMLLSEDNRDRMADRPMNIVMMGMGEALHNYDASLRAVRLLADPEGLGVPRRRIILSTAGLAPAIRRLAAEPVRPRLAVSLNATTDETRSRLMPINRRHPLADLLDACAAFPLAPRERITFEYVLLEGINDAAEDPARLASLVRRHRLRAKVNLIPYNGGESPDFREPATDVVRRFRDALIALGVPASVRRNRGRDIQAACGQLLLAPTGSGREGHGHKG